MSEVQEAPPNAYQPQTPWQAIGTHRSHFDSVEEAMREAKLDWKVGLDPLYRPVEFDESGNPTRYREIPDRFAVVRDSDHRYLGTVGGTYHPLQNAEAFSPLDVAVREFGVQITGAGAFSLDALRRRRP